MIDTSEIKEITDFSKVRKNPYADKLRNNGFSIIINVSPEDIADMTRQNVETIKGMGLLELDVDEQKAFEKYLEANGQKP